MGGICVESSRRRVARLGPIVVVGGTKLSGVPGAQMSRRPSVCRRIRVLRHNRKRPSGIAARQPCAEHKSCLPNRKLKLSDRTLKYYDTAPRIASSILGRPRIPPPGLFGWLDPEVDHLGFGIAQLHHDQKRKRPPVL